MIINSSDGTTAAARIGDVEEGRLATPLSARPVVGRIELTPNGRRRQDLV